MKTKLGIVVVACVALFVSACGSSSENLIVGKWEAGEGVAKITAEFTKDAKAKITILGKTLQGTYKINGDGELEWTMNGITKKGKVKVTSTELELTQEGKTIKYKKV
jgi:major membrane immunogen (membrane-anchored lipoprotein)